MEDYSNIILSIAVAMLIYLILDSIDEFRENFDQYSFKCIQDEKFIYIESIREIEQNLVNDGYLETDSFETGKLLQIYDIILCDLKNISNDNIFYLKIVSHFNIVLNTNNILEVVDVIINKCLEETNKIIKDISKVSEEETYNKYLNLNTFIFENIKQEILLKIL